MGQKIYENIVLCADNNCNGCHFNSPFVHIGEIAEFLAFGIGMLLYALSPLLIALFFAAIFAPVVDFFQRIYDKIRKKHTDEYGKRTAGTILLYLVCWNRFDVPFWVLGK